MSPTESPTASAPTRPVRIAIVGAVPGDVADLLRSQSSHSALRGLTFVLGAGLDVLEARGVVDDVGDLRAAFSGWMRRCPPREPGRAALSVTIDGDLCDGSSGRPTLHAG